MKLCYVAGPYRDKRGPYFVQANIRAAEDVAVSLWDGGYSVICPHKNTQLLDGRVKVAQLLAGDFEQISRCDFIVVLSGWEDSVGTKKEIKAAEINNVPVYYWPHDKEDLMAGRLGDRWRS